MRRRDFFRKALFATGLTLNPFQSKAKENKEEKETITVVQSPKEETFTFDELFFKPFKTNQNLFYLKNNSKIAELLYATGKIDYENFDPKQAYLCTGVYYPLFNLVFEIKETYTANDFKPLINFLNSRRYDNEFRPFAGSPEGYGTYMSPVRFILESKAKGLMKTELLIKHM